MRRTGRSQADALAEFWPSAGDAERLRIQARVRKWVQRDTRPDPRPEPAPPPPVVKVAAQERTPRPVVSVAGLSYLDFLAAEIDALSADLAVARADGRFDHVARLSALRTEMRQTLEQERTKAASAVRIDRTPAAIAAQLEKQSRAIALKAEQDRRRQAAEAVKAAKERDL